MEILSTKERKLIEKLDFNARDTLSQLGRGIGVSKQAVDHMLKSLETKGIITGYYPIIDSFRLGFMYCRLSLVLQNASQNEFNEILRFLKDDPDYFWVFRSQGEIDLLIAMWCKSVTDFRMRIQKLLSKFGSIVARKEESIATDVIHYPYRFLTESKNETNIDLKETIEVVKIDEIDKKILQNLCVNARMPLVNISAKCDISTKVVAYRIKNMEKRSIIRGYRPIIDNVKMGYTYYKLWINVNMQEIENISKIIEYVAQNPIVIYAVKGIAFPYDLDIEIMIKSNDELLDLIFDLRKQFPKAIGDYKSFIYLETVKVCYLPF